ncbi:MAG: response regulator [Alphaproteobacteria bacterium]|nr:response regulator [Alphaproteobacteria bacterium]
MVAQVLVVDDNVVIRSVVRKALEESGHAVTLAENGERALQAGAAGSGFDLIITDIEMPRMGGVDLVTAIRKSRPDAKILVMSGRFVGADLKGMMSAKTFGVQGSLEKPFTAGKLVAKVAEILG